MPSHRSRNPILRRPSGPRLLRLAWSDVLFLHWPVDPRGIRACVPPDLEIELFENRAWISLVASAVSGARPAIIPPLPGLSSFLELHLRTYVSHGGEPGVYFFSLDVSNPAVAWLARSVFHLAYFRARMDTRRRDETMRFASRRTHQGAAAAEFECVWGAGRPLPRAHPGDLVHFLTERLQVFAVHRRKVMACRLWHEPWDLREARLKTFRSTVVEASGLKVGDEPPLAHHADALALSVWPVCEATPVDAGAPLLDPALSPPVASFIR